MRKKLQFAFYAFAFIGIALSLGMVSSSFTTKSKISQFNKDDAPKWKNLKVLPQDISKDSLFTLMKGYSMALGVKCSYCHVPVPNSDKLDFVSDEKKEKEYARQMIAMTREINAQYFNWENIENPETIDHVKCVMCHQGSPSPTTHLQNIGFFYQQASDKR